MRVDPPGGLRVEALQFGVEVGDPACFDPGAKLFANWFQALLRGELVGVDHRLDVQASSSHQERQPVPGANLLDFLTGQVLKLGDRKLLVRLQEAQQVVRHASLLPGRDSGGADIQVLVHLNGIGRDDLAAKPQGEVHG